MRKPGDRLRHAIFFEIIGLLTCVPLASLILDKGLLQIGGLSIVLSLIAMLVNYGYNIIFDHALLRLGREVHVRPVWLRIVHAVFFEASLVLLTLPLVAWWLDMTLAAAFITDVGFMLYFLIYAFVYNWAYDSIFPMVGGPAAPVATK